MNNYEWAKKTLKSTFQMIEQMVGSDIFINILTNGVY